MNLTREILIKNGIHPSLITKNSEHKFQDFCQSAGNSNEFLAFADRYERLLISAKNVTLEFRKQGKEIIKEALKITETVSKSIKNSLISAFIPLTENAKDNFMRAVISLETPILRLKKLVAQCAVRDDQSQQELQTELTLRFIALKEYSCENNVISRYSSLTKAVADENDHLTQLKEETVLFFEKAISALSSLVAEGDRFLSDKKHPQAGFFALLQRHQLILHDIFQQL